MCFPISFNPSTDCYLDILATPKRYVFLFFFLFSAVDFAILANNFCYILFFFWFLLPFSTIELADKQSHSCWGLGLKYTFPVILQARVHYGFASRDPSCTSRLLHISTVKISSRLLHIIGPNHNNNVSMTFIKRSPKN